MRYRRRVRPFPGSRRLLLLVAALAAVLAACDLPTFGAPESKSEQGDSITALWQGFFLTAIGVALLVWGLIIYVLVRYRRRRRKQVAAPGATGDGDTHAGDGDTHTHAGDGVGDGATHVADGDPAEDDDEPLPNQRPYNIPLEIVYTTVPVVIVAVLFGFSVATEENVNRLDPDPAAVVEVVGFQWSWQFVYEDEDVTITGEPGEPPEMVLPVGRPARLVLRTDDVNHAFWVPDFLSKRDLIPGVDNEIDVTPTETGEYVGRCAEFCGLDHWRMTYTVRVVPEDEYEDWLAEQQEEQQAEQDEQEQQDEESEQPEASS